MTRHEPHGGFPLNRMTHSRWLTVSETAEAFGVTPEAVRSWARNGHIPEACRTVGGHWRIPKAWVERNIKPKSEDSGKAG